jgi:hypothetical protein
MNKKHTKYQLIEKLIWKLKHYQKWKQEEFLKTSPRFYDWEREYNDVEIKIQLLEKLQDWHVEKKKKDIESIFFCRCKEPFIMILIEEQWKLIVALWKMYLRKGTIKKIINKQIWELIFINHKEITKEWEQLVEYTTIW